jgi:hypothetical protein
MEARSGKRIIKDSVSKNKLGIVVYIFNPSNVGGRKITVQGHPKQKVQHQKAQDPL